MVEATSGHGGTDHYTSSLGRLGVFKDDVRPSTVMTVPRPKKEVDLLWTGYFIMPHTEQLNDLHGRTMVNIVGGETFHICDKNSPEIAQTSGLVVSQDDGRRNQSHPVQSRKQVLRS